MSHAGTVLQAELANRIGLTAALSEATDALRERGSGHDPGRVLVGVAVATADGARTMSDVQRMADQVGLHGLTRSVASTATIWLVLVGIDNSMLADIRQVRAAARARARSARGELTAAELQRGERTEHVLHREEAAAVCPNGATNGSRLTLRGDTVGQTDVSTRHGLSWVPGAGGRSSSRLVPPGSVAFNEAWTSVSGLSVNTVWKRKAANNLPLLKTGVGAVGRAGAALAGAARLARVEASDPADQEPAGGLLGLAAAGERGERDFGDLGAADQSLGLLVPDRVRVVDRLSGGLRDAFDCPVTAGLARTVTVAVAVAVAENRTSARRAVTSTGAGHRRDQRVQALHPGLAVPAGLLGVAVRCLDSPTSTSTNASTSAPVSTGACPASRASSRASTRRADGRDQR